MLHEADGMPPQDERRLHEADGMRDVNVSKAGFLGPGQKAPVSGRSQAAGSRRQRGVSRPLTSPLDSKTPMAVSSGRKGLW